MGVAAAGVAAAGALLWFGTGHKNPVPVPLYMVVRVFDGDTFETAEKQYIRLSGIDAPELGRCGSSDATKELERLVLKTPVYIKILYHTGARSNGLVYSKDGLVNATMLASGWAVMNDRDNVDLPELYRAAAEARSKKIGIFSTLCTQTTNAACPIKGNIGVDDKKIYHTPDCTQYKNVIVELYKGDQWFCSEREAKAAGFTKNRDCP
jgi:endonuclease YncB( thermonuclease family)